MKFILCILSNQFAFGDSQITTVLAYMLGLVIDGCLFMCYGNFDHTPLYNILQSHFHLPTHTYTQILLHLLIVNFVIIL